MWDALPVLIQLVAAIIAVVLSCVTWGDHRALLLLKGRFQTNLFSTHASSSFFARLVVLVRPVRSLFLLLSSTRARGTRHLKPGADPRTGSFRATGRGFHYNKLLFRRLK